MAVKSSSSIESPCKMFPNWDFWFENKPSGNPAAVKAYFSISDLVSTFLTLKNI
jgi:hypothetical protein